MISQFGAFISSLISQVSALIQAHIAFVSLLLLAFVVTMREKLPAPFDRVPIFVWSYGWLHDALKTFVSLRGPTASESTEFTHPTKTVVSPDQTKPTPDSIKPLN